MSVLTTFKLYFLRCLITPTALLGLLFAGALFGQARPTKKAAEKQIIDPSLITMEGQLSFDEETQKALERSKIPGVLEAEREEAGMIKRMEIKAKKVETDAIVLRLTSKIGREYNPVFVADDILSIMKMGLFSNVKVLKNVLSSGAIELRYELEEIPTIFQVKIIGNDALSEDEIKESIVGLENYHIADQKRLNDYAKKIAQLYREKGHFLATVAVTTEPTSKEDIQKRNAEGMDTGTASIVEIQPANVAADDFVNVKFTIVERDKVVINRISFAGNFHISDDQFKDVIRSREKHILSIISDWGTFRKENQEIDPLIMEEVLHRHGFLKAKVLPPDISISADKTTIDIAFRIIENTQYRLGEVSIIGDLLETSELVYRLKQKRDPKEAVFLESDLRDLIEQKSGDIFNKSLMAENVLAIAQKYRDEGYAYVNVSPIPVFNEEEKTVAIQVQIESGPKVYIERIDIEGNEKTRDDVIRRELLLLEGDKSSANLLTLSEEAVSRLGYFESVDVSTKPGSVSDKMVITIKVKEQNTGNVQAGAGYGTGGEGLILRGQISNQNLFGRGQTLSLTLNWSNYRNMFDVTFVEPYLAYIFDSPLSFAFTAYNRDIFLGEFNRKATGGTITLGYPLGGPFAEISRTWKRNVGKSLAPYVFDFEALMFMLTYTVERVEISDLSTAVNMWDLYQKVPRYTASLGPAIHLDQRDNRMFPSRGLYFEFRSEFASEFLGSSVLAGLENKIHSTKNTDHLSAGLSYKKPLADANNFLRFGTTLRFYHNLDEWFFLKGLVFKTNLEIGILNTLGKPLIFENYSLGGNNSLRGYAYRSISPVARASALFPFDARRDVGIGGNKEIHGSFELEFPIFKALKIGGVLFFDYGNVFSHEDNFFYAGQKSANASRIKPADPLKLYQLLGLYSSVGFGIRWLSPLGYLRFEWGFPLNPRPAGTPGLYEKDPPVAFEFNIGPSF